MVLWTYLKAIAEIIIDPKMELTTVILSNYLLRIYVYTYRTGLFLTLEKFLFLVSGSQYRDS